MFKKMVVLSLGILAFSAVKAQSIFPPGQTGFVGADNCFEYTLHGAGLIQGVEPEWTEFTIDVCMPWVLGGLEPGDVDIGSDFDVESSWVMGPWGVGYISVVVTDYAYTPPRVHSHTIDWSECEDDLNTNPLCPELLDNKYNYGPTLFDCQQDAMAHSSYAYSPILGFSPDPQCRVLLEQAAGNTDSGNTVNVGMRILECTNFQSRWATGIQNCNVQLMLASSNPFDLNLANIIDQTNNVATAYVTSRTASQLAAIFAESGGAAVSDIFGVHNSAGNFAEYFQCVTDVMRDNYLAHNYDYCGQYFE